MSSVERPGVDKDGNARIQDSSEIWGKYILDMRESKRVGWEK